jgi:hypothetical protein
VLFGSLEFIRVEQISGDEPHLLASFAKIIKWNLVVASAAAGVVDASFEFLRSGFQTLAAALRLLQKAALPQPFVESVKPF